MGDIYRQILDGWGWPFSVSESDDAEVDPSQSQDENAEKSGIPEYFQSPRASSTPNRFNLRSCTKTNLKGKPDLEQRRSSRRLQGLSPEAKDYLLKSPFCSLRFGIADYVNSKSRGQQALIKAMEEEAVELADAEVALRSNLALLRSRSMKKNAENTEKRRRKRSLPRRVKFANPEVDKVDFDEGSRCLHTHMTMAQELLYTILMIIFGICSYYVFFECKLVCLKS